MAEKLEKMQAMAALAKQFGGDPESEMRNRLLEAQIQAGREQTQAMRHQTQGGMMKSMMDMQKMQGDLQLNPLRREALGAEIAASKQRTLSSQSANVRAGELHKETVLGQQEINEGRRTANAQLILQGEERVRKSLLEERKLKGELAVQERGTKEWDLNEDRRTQERETALLIDEATRLGIPSSQIADYLSKVGPSLDNLPPNMREIAGTGLQELDPNRRSPEGAPFSKRIEGPMVTPNESTASLMAETQALMWALEQLAKGRNTPGMTEEDKAKLNAEANKSLQSVMDAVKQSQQSQQR